MNDELLVKSLPTSKHLNWIKWLEADELVEFFAELFKLITRISEGKKDTDTLTSFLSGWRETALINSEPDVLADIAEAEQELDAGGGKPWSQIKKEIGLRMLSHISICLLKILTGVDIKKRDTIRIKSLPDFRRNALYRCPFL